jgi:peptide-methionine (S)-S-oxide reductase
MRSKEIALLIGLLGGISLFFAQAQNTTKSSNSTVVMDNHNANNLAEATFGAGCFWCVEAVFQELEGVVSVVSGYSGGHVVNPTYEEICRKTTGHAEVARITYQPDVISFDELLEVFWQTHDPTTLNRQGNDVGPQYRSVVYYHDEAQKQKAEYYKKELDASGAFAAPIVTEISPLINFYEAENYHQNFYNNNENYPYCVYVVKPKVDKVRKVFKDKLKVKTP